MICFAKPLIAEDVSSTKGRLFNNMLYVRDVYLTKAKHIHKRQTHLLVREDVTYALCSQGFSCTKNSGRESQGDWRQDELIGSRPPVIM
jgi:hypothetical protein